MRDDSFVLGVWSATRTKRTPAGNQACGLAFRTDRPRTGQRSRKRGLASTLREAARDSAEARRCAKSSYSRRCRRRELNPPPTPIGRRAPFHPRSWRKRSAVSARDERNRGKLPIESVVWRDSMQKPTHASVTMSPDENLRSNPFPKHRPQDSCPQLPFARPSHRLFQKNMFLQANPSSALR